MGLNARGSETLTASTAGSTYALTLPTSNGSVFLAVMRPEAGLAYITFDGSAPSSVNGITMSTGPGVPYRFDFNDLEDAKVVFSTTDATLNIHYFG
jgi:hypothetical protein